MVASEYFAEFLREQLAPQLCASSSAILIMVVG